MAYAAQVIEVMIASPSDVNKEREAAADTIYRLNAIQARSTGRVLLPVRWETHSASDLGGRAQQQINDRVLKFCDLAVGIFWTKLGTPTGTAESGSVEEIEEHLKAGKPAMAFFSQHPVLPGSVNSKEYDRLLQFKAKCRDWGITWDYDDPAHFEHLFYDHLQIVLTQNPYFTNLESAAQDSDPRQFGEAPPSPISPEAVQILSGAVANAGQIVVFPSMAGRIIQTGNGTNFGSSDARIAAKFDFALEELEHLDFIKPQGAKRQVFKVTKLGYDYIDSLTS